MELQMTVHLHVVCTLFGVPQNCKRCCRAAQSIASDPLRLINCTPQAWARLPKPSATWASLASRHTTSGGLTSSSRPPGADRLSLQFPCIGVPVPWCGLVCYARCTNRPAH